MRKGWLIVIGIVVALGLAWWYLHNRIVTCDENIDSAWAQVETVLQRRYDLIPNLVNTVKGYATHEKELLENVTAMRSQWAQAKTVDARVQAATQLEGVLGRLMLVMENYPDLKANQNFLALQDELAGTENRIATERRRYNDAVRIYKSTIRRFPANIVAGMEGHRTDRQYFESSEGAKEVPKVQF